MKSAEEMTRDVLLRRDQYRAERACRARRQKKLSAVLAVLLLAVGITGVGYAAADSPDIRAFFRSIFTAGQDTVLSERQGDYLAERTAAVGDSVTQNGYTVTLEGALADGPAAYLLLNITAPENVRLEGRKLGMDAEFEGLRQAGQEDAFIGSVTASCTPIEDHDGMGHTASLLLRYQVETFGENGFSFADGRARTLRLQNLRYWKEEYPWDAVTVAEETWEFEVEFASADTESEELLCEPVSASYCRISGDPVDAVIGSVELNGLHVRVYYDIAPDEVQEAGDFGILEFVRTDGSLICAYPERAGENISIEDGVPVRDGFYCAYTLESPLFAEEITELRIAGMSVEIEVQ